MNNETTLQITYEIQNLSEANRRWEWVTQFSTQEVAEECLHRTGSFEELPPLITVDNPNWRIIEVELVERVNVVARVSAVLQGDRYVMAREA